jgi:hypothetical protein
MEAMTVREHIEKFAVVEPNTGCWLWAGCVQRGYGVVTRQVEGSGKKRFYAHRLSYESFRGPIPDGLQLDHLCRVTVCVNPEHLELVTCRVNVLRGHTRAAANQAKTHCIHGHSLLDPSNMRRNGRMRVCRACLRANNARCRQRHRDQLPMSPASTVYNGDPPPDRQGKLIP